jgi:two-component system cell cycle sensor histidine kinase/response regulator CckA
MKPTGNKAGYFQKFQTFVMNRMAPSSVIEKDSLTYWRVRILFAIIFTGLLLGLFIFVPSFAFLIKESLWGLLVFNVCAWVIGLSLLLSRRLKYEIRAAMALLIVYAIGLLIIIFVGPLSGGPAWLFGFAVLVGVLLGSKAAIMALTVNAITLTIIGWLISIGLFGKTFPFFKTTEAMIGAGANFIFLNTIAAISVSVLVKGLVSARQKERDLTETLEKERSYLIAAKKELESEVEERKQTEKALRESEARYQDLYDNAPDMHISVDAKTATIINCNQTLADALGYTKEEIFGRSVFDMYAPDSAGYAKAHVFPMFLKTGTIEGEELQLQRKDGVLIDVSLNVSAVRDEKGHIIHSRSSLRDISDKKKLEAQLQRAQKMEAIGTLAGGVAHDLNNILSGIVSYPDLILMDLPEDNPLRKPILTIQQSGEQAAAIVQDLLTMARRGVVATKVTNLNQIINSYLKSPECEKLKEFHPGVTIESDLERNLLNIMGSPVHLLKTVMNLVSNAAEAMPDGGNIFISTKSEYIDKPISGYDDVKEGDYVILTVSDSGVGISSENIERIFEPFYTKKVMGKSGTGLGMAVVWGTVKDHRGYIDVQSEEGKGTAFTLYFPVTRKEITGKEEALPAEEYMGKGESILVVDDVEEQREIASGILRRLGYSVTTVASGEEAIDHLKDNSADLIILDMIMDPGIDGLETYKRILELHPSQKAIIASGFSETDRVKEAQRLGAGQYIKKPYTLEKIGIAVREELENKSFSGSH